MSQQNCSQDFHTRSGLYQVVHIRCMTGIQGILLNHTKVLISPSEAST